MAPDGSLFGVSCNLGCAGKKIYFGLLYAQKGDTLKIYFDKKLVVDKAIEAHYTGYFQDRKDKLTTVCAIKDSILTKVVVNKRDTTFLIHPNEINECYVGSDIAGGIRIYYNYVDGGFREYDPKR